MNPFWLWQVLGGHSRDAARYASEKANEAHERADMKKTRAWSWGSHKADQASEKAEEARQRASESMGWGREKADEL